MTDDPIALAQKQYRDAESRVATLRGEFLVALENQKKLGEQLALASYEVGARRAYLDSIINKELINEN